MVSKWSKQNLIKDLEHVRDGDNEYIDDRGKISNHELTEPINLIGLIDSKKGTIRANHYQITYYLLLLLLVFGVVQLWNHFKNDQHIDFFKKIGVLFLAGFFALGLNATSLLATSEYSKFSTRGKSELTLSATGVPIEARSGLSYDYITQFSYGIFESLNLIAPRIQGGGSSEDLGSR